MAQTLKFGNKTWATKVGSTLAYNDENGNYKPLPFAFTRSTSATRVNKEGLIEVVTNDRPRIDYTDTSDGVLLLEKAATNLVTYSEAFSNAYWTKEKASIVSNAVISPDGTSNASKLVEDSSNGLHRIYTNLITTSQNNNYTSSVFAKKGGRNIFGIQTSSGAQPYVWFNLDKGIVELQESSIVGKIESLANGWYKCSATWNSSSATNDRVFIQLAKSISNTSYTGDGSSGVYIFGAQFEIGNVASSYIPTQGSAVTRVAETASGAGNSEVFSDSQGVLFFDGSVFATNENLCISINDGGATGSGNRVELLWFSDGKFYTQVGNSGQEFISSNTLNNKILIKYGSGTYHLYVNGFRRITDTYTSLSGLVSLDFKRQGSFTFKGKTKELGYYNTILTDLELETLTSYKSWTSMVNELNLNIIYNG